ncbi:4Fe-4S binding protein [Archaeoglobus sp.]
MITVNDKCNGCGICKVVCPYDRVRIFKGKSEIEECEECGICLKFCPFDAIEIRRELREFEVEKSLAQTTVVGGVKLDVSEVKPKSLPVDAHTPNLKFAVKMKKPEILDFKAYELLKVCSHCGACLLCKNNALELKDKPILVGNCINCGFCLYVCPKFNTACVERTETKTYDVDFKTVLHKLVGRYSLIVWDSIVDDEKKLEDVLSKMRIEVDYEKCVSCGLCAKICPISAVSIKDHPTFQNCFLCGLCVKNCLQKALKKPKYPTVKLLKEKFDRAVFVGFPCDVLAVKRLKDDRIVCTVSLQCVFCEFDENCSIEDCADITIGEKTIVRTERGDRVWKSLE